jgi:chromosome condensin MukBEF ATPase and DNA-binding subunit MukB
MMIYELLEDYPLRYRSFWNPRGYAAKLSRAREVAERFQDERNAALLRAKIAEDECAQLRAQIADARRALESPPARAGRAPVRMATA